MKTSTGIPDFVAGDVVLLDGIDNELELLLEDEEEAELLCRCSTFRFRNSL